MIQMVIGQYIKIHMKYIYFGINGLKTHVQTSIYRSKHALDHSRSVYLIVYSCKENMKSVLSMVIFSSEYVLKWCA